MSTAKVYAVRKGREVGLFDDWATVLPLVSGFSGAQYKKFCDREDALAWLDGDAKPAAETAEATTAITRQQKVYTDGSAGVLSDGKEYASYGVYFEGLAKYSGKVVEGAMNSPRAELYAIVKALHLWEKNKADWFPNGEVVLTLCTDCMYAYNCAAKWVQKWSERGWYTQTGKPQNMDLCKELLDYLERMPEVRFRHVRGHYGVRGNEEADRLAKKAAQE